MLVIDMIQFFIKMTAVIAAAYFALQAPQVGGLDGLVDEAVDDARAGRPQLPEHAAGLHEQLGALPSRSSSCRSPCSGGRCGIPGAEPGGGSYIAQRMLASKSEKDALGAVLFFNVAHYVLRPWPWILVGALLADRLSGAVATSRGRFPTSIRG